MRCNKKGQLTIFIIVGILIVGTIAGFFLIRQGLIPDIIGGKEINPNSFLEACLEEKISEAVNILSMQGGNINPKLYKRFKFEEDNQYWNISYLCYNQNSYDMCVNQVPMLVNHLEKEIENYIREDVKICFDELEHSLEKQNYDVKKKYEGFEINLELNKIILKINGGLELTKLDETTIQNNIGVIINSRLYNLLLIVNEIVNSEAQYCDFNINSYMLMYPEIKIKLFIDGEGVKIYIVEERDVEASFRFAIRGCIIE